MKNPIVLKGACLLLSILCACSPDLEHTILSQIEGINKIVVTLPESPLLTNSRTNIEVGNTVKYTWASTDTLGIFPDVGFQAAFPTASSSGSASATFSGGGWALKPSSQYAAYYPFNYDNRRIDCIPISYLGQKQKGNKNTYLVGKYDFLAAKATTPTNGAVDFKMERLGRFIILKFNVPEPTTLKSVKFSSSFNVFIKNGYIDLTADPLSINCNDNNSKSSYLTIDLEDITTTKSNEEVTVYFFTNPINLQYSLVNIEVTDINNNILKYIAEGKDLRPNKAYALMLFYQQKRLQ